MNYLKMAVFASHGGSNLQAIIDACREDKIYGEVAVVISNNSRSFALQRAKNFNIVNHHMSSLKYPDPVLLDEAILAVLTEHAVNLIVLAGYMKKMGRQVLQNYKGRILNIHPALLPKYGGRGMFGLAVHEAVLSSGDKKTGATVHLVEEDYDTGPIVSQWEVAVEEDDTVQRLADRVLVQEHLLYVDTLMKISRGLIDLDSCL